MASNIFKSQFKLELSSIDYSERHSLFDSYTASTKIFLKTIEKMETNNTAATVAFLTINRVYIFRFICNLQLWKTMDDKCFRGQPKKAQVSFLWEALEIGIIHSHQLSIKSIKKIDLRFFNIYDKDAFISLSIFINLRERSFSLDKTNCFMNLSSPSSQFIN